MLMNFSEIEGYGTSITDQVVQLELADADALPQLQALQVLLFAREDLLGGWTAALHADYLYSIIGERYFFRWGTARVSSSATKENEARYLNKWIEKLYVLYLR